MDDKTMNSFLSSPSSCHSSSCLSLFVCFLVAVLNATAGRHEISRANTRIRSVVALPKMSCSSLICQAVRKKWSPIAKKINSRALACQLITKFVERHKCLFFNNLC
jgi:hypothetical protein